MWCAVNPLFLTPASKAVLLGDLCAVIDQELSADADAFRPVLGNIAGLRQNLLDKEGAADSKLELSRKTDEHYAEAKKCNGTRDQELIDAASCLLHSDMSSAWTNAVSSYLGAATNESQLQRALTIIRLVEKRL